MSNYRIGDINVAFLPSRPVSDVAYPPLKHTTTTLKAGTAKHEGAMVLPCDILFEKDVAVRLRDGTTLYVDIYRPVNQQKVPAIMGWSPYGKAGDLLSNDAFPNRMDVPPEWEDGYNIFEGPNPAYWVNQGYAVIAPDSRGAYYSEGDLHAWGPQESNDICDVIEWVAEQHWSNKKVGMTGNSWLAMSQWFVAAKPPSALAAIAPWEGATDLYRDIVYAGGIADIAFSKTIFSMLPGSNQSEDLAGMALQYPLRNSYWQSKTAALQDISLPAYIVGSWSNILHTNGTLRGWEQSRSKQKWLRIHDHFEWPDYYNPANVDDLRRFFDYYLKGQDNGWPNTPRVRLSVLDPGHENTVNRPETEFPLARQQLTNFYLARVDQQYLLQRSPPTSASKIVYDAKNGECVFSLTFTSTVEITGYIALKIWVQALGNDDADLYAIIRKRDQQGLIQAARITNAAPFSGPNGRLRASLRNLDAKASSAGRPYHSFDRVQKLSEEDIVALEFNLTPCAMRWHKGETLELIISGASKVVRPEFASMPTSGISINQGKHVIHIGGQYPSSVLLPIVPV